MTKSSVIVGVNQTSFVPGETIRITVQIDSAAEDIKNVTNVSVNLYRVDVERNQFSFGFGTTPILKGNVLEISNTLPKTLQRGLYLIHHVTLSRGDIPEATEQASIQFDPVLFAVRAHVEKPYSSKQIDELRLDTEKRRADYINSVIETEAAKKHPDKTRQFRVLIFGVGCLLHAHQQLKGYYISPLGIGFSHRRMHEIVNTVLEREGTDGLEFSEETEQRFASSTPLFLVAYTKVDAIDENDALNYCRSHAELLFQILGLDRGQMPREFACIAFEYGSNTRWHLYQMPGYRGNLASDFNPVSTANWIEEFLPRLQNNPFARLLAKTYADATAESDYGFSLLRYWSVMELAADKRIQSDGTPLKHPDGSPILKENGKPETTRSKHGRVYSYILTNGSYKTQGSYRKNGSQNRYMIGGSSSDPGYTPSTELISLWSLVRAIYAIRNAIAHEGQFDLDKAAGGDTYQKLAARLKTEGHPDLLDFIKHQARAVLWRET